jgi:hypothetical protein
MYMDHSLLVTSKPGDVRRSWEVYEGGNHTSQSRDVMTQAADARAWKKHFDVGGAVWEQQLERLKDAGEGCFTLAEALGGPVTDIVLE